MADIPAWYSPETTIWRDRPDIQDAYKELIASGVAHIIREVRARLPGLRQPLSTEAPDRYDAATLWELAGKADGEFAILRACGIHVPNVEWHVPEHEGASRLIARVDVVRGGYDLYSEGHGSQTHAAFERNRDRYYGSDEPGDRLNEVNARQCVAVPCGAEPQIDQAYMVDVEPIF